MLRSRTSFPHRRLSVRYKLATRILSFALLYLGAGYAAFAGEKPVAKADADWPQLLGPRRDACYRGPALRNDWPVDFSPRWRRPVGEGFSGPVAQGQRVIVFHRQGDNEIVECLELASGKPHWKKSYPTPYRDSFGFEEGPRATPSIASNRVYTFGAAGTLSAFDLKTGELAWRIETHEVYKPRSSFFGAASSPLVVGDRLYLSVGGTKEDANGRGSGIVAFDANSGQEVWTQSKSEAGYSSPVLAKMGDEQRLVFFTREGLEILDPKTGAAIYSKRWRARIAASVNAACPLVASDTVLVTSSYRTGALAVRRVGKSFEELWSGDTSLSAHYTSPVVDGAHAYGLHGRQEYGPELRCIELASGKVLWKLKGRKAGTLLKSGKRILYLDDGGLLQTFQASPEKFQPGPSLRVLTGTTRPHPALASGHFLARDTQELVCFDLRPPAPR